MVRERASSVLLKRHARGNERTKAPDFRQESGCYHPNQPSHVQDSTASVTSDRRPDGAVPPELHFIVSADGTILQYYGRSSADLYAPPGTFLGRTLHDVLPAPAASQIADALSRVRDGCPPVAVEYTLPMSGRSGRSRHA